MATNYYKHVLENGQDFFPVQKKLNLCEDMSVLALLFLPIVLLKQIFAGCVGYNCPSSCTNSSICTSSLVQICTIADTCFGLNYTITDVTNFTLLCQDENTCYNHDITLYNVQNVNILLFCLTIYLYLCIFYTYHFFNQ